MLSRLLSGIFKDRRFLMKEAVVLALVGFTLENRAASKGEAPDLDPSARPQQLPAAVVDDLALREWRFKATNVDWELLRIFSGCNYVLKLSYSAGGRSPSSGGILHLNDYNLFRPLSGWIPPAVGVKVRAIEFWIRPERQTGDAKALFQWQQERSLAGQDFSRKTPLNLGEMPLRQWTHVQIPVDLVSDNRLCDVAFCFEGSADDSACSFYVSGIRLLCTDGSRYEVVNDRAPSYLEGLSSAALGRQKFRPLPQRPLVQLGLGSWPVVTGRSELARIGEWGRKYCPEFDIVLSMGGSPEPCLQSLHQRLPDNVYLQFQKAQHGYRYPALFDALPRNEYGDVQNFAFNSIIATHPLIQGALDEQLVYVASLGINNFQSYDYVWLYKDALWGYDQASLASFREDLCGRDGGLVLADGRTIGFADYFRAYHGIDPRPDDYGYAAWSEFAPETEKGYLADGERGSRRFELFAMLRNYEWLLQAQRWNDRAAGYGGRYDYLLNCETWANANDHFFLLKLRNTGIVSPEYFSAAPKKLELYYHHLGQFVREARRSGKRFGMTVETSCGGGDSQPYWSPKTGFAVCYALAGIGLNSFEYDHVAACSIWSPETYRSYNPNVSAHYAQATERHLLGDMRGYRRARVDSATRPDATSVLVLVRRPVSRETESVDWVTKLDRLGYDYAVTDIVELSGMLDGARVIFAGSEAHRPGTREMLAKWKAGKEGRLLLGNPDAADLEERLVKLDLPRKRIGASDTSAIALRFKTKVGESAVLFDRHAVESADRTKWYDEKWAPSFHKYVADPKDYLYSDDQPGGVCRVSFAVGGSGRYRVYRYLEDREEEVDVEDAALTLDNSGRLCEVFYFAPDSAEFREFLEEVKADRRLTADAFVTD